MKAPIINTLMPTPTSMAMWSLEPLLWEGVVVAEEGVVVAEKGVVVADAGPDEAGTSWRVRLECAVDSAVNEDEVLVGFTPGRVATAVAFPRKNRKDDVEQHSSPRSQQQKFPSPHGRNPRPVTGSRNHGSSALALDREEGEKARTRDVVFTDLHALRTLPVAVRAQAGVILVESVTLGVQRPLLRQML